MGQRTGVTRSGAALPPSTASAGLCAVSIPEPGSHGSRALTSATDSRAGSRPNWCTPITNHPHRVVVTTSYQARMVSHPANHILEAISSGICEVVERDALALWERRTTLARARRKVDLATIDNPDCLALLDLYERSGTAVQVWDITTECGIPVLLCDIRPRVHDPSAMSRRSTRSRLSCRSCCRSRQGADGSRAGSAYTHHRYARRHFLRCIRRRPGSKGRSGFSRRPRCSPATPFLQRGPVVHVG